MDFMGFVLGCYGGSGGFCGYFWWRWFCGGGFVGFYAMMVVGFVLRFGFNFNYFLR